MKNIVLLKEQLLQLEKRLLQTEVRTCPEKLSELLTDEFFEFGSSGKVWRKQDIESKQGIGAVRMTLSQFDIQPLCNDVVLATYRIYNEENKQHTLRSSIWKYKENKWQMVFHQGTITSGN